MGSGCCGSKAEIDVGVFGNTISVILVGVLPVFSKFDAFGSDTGLSEEIQALISGFKSAIGSGGLSGVNFEIRGVIVVAAVIESGVDTTDASDELIIEGGGSTNVGGVPSSSITFCRVALMRLLLNWHFFDVMCEE